VSTLKPNAWIDVHAHYTAPEFYDFASDILGQEIGIRVVDGREVLKRPGQPDREFRTGELSKEHELEGRLEDMDRKNIAVQVLSPGGAYSFYEQPTTAASELTQVLNDGLVQACHRHWGRFWCFISVPLQDVKASIEEMRRLASDPSVKGVRIGTTIGDIELDDPQLWPFWEACEELDYSVFIHPFIYNIPGADRMRDYYLANMVGYPTNTTLAAARLMFGGVLGRFEAIRFCLSHAGGYLPAAWGRFKRGMATKEECRSSVSSLPEEWIRRFYVDSIAHSPDYLLHAANTFGKDRILCGTDHPFDIGDPEPWVNVDAIAESPEELEDMLSGNALRFMRSVSDTDEAPSISRLAR
jgi:aminocarboxymuconate-semialdehyde decarboxylase